MNRCAIAHSVSALLLLAGCSDSTVGPGENASTSAGTATQAVVGTTSSVRPTDVYGSTTTVGQDATTTSMVPTTPAPDFGPAPVFDLPADQPQPQWPAFELLSSDAGVTMWHGATLQHHAIGQAWGDYDRDGWLDLFLTGGTLPSKLFHNEGDGTFTESPFSAGLSALEFTSGGPAWADYDNDGWLDLYVTCDGPNLLFHNDEGNGFTERGIVANVHDDRNGVMAAWGDYDRDGWLDLYVANHGGQRDAFYRNNADGTFSDVGSLIDISSRDSSAFAATFLDFDNDGDLDLHVVNDHIDGNDLFRNEGPGCGGWCFSNVADLVGADLYINGMGQAVGDYDNDGDLDLFFSDIFFTHLLVSSTAQGVPAFEEVSIGLNFPAISWGTVFIDYDNDGWLDLYLATQDSAPFTNRLLRNLGDGSFDDVSNHSGADNDGFTYGVAYADYDHDGFVDLVIGNRGQSYELYRNTTTTGPGHHWVTFMLEGGGPINRDAIGARLTVTDTDGLQHMAELRSGSTMGGGNSMRLHFGLGAAEVQSVHVRWPDGLEQEVGGVPTDALVPLSYPAP